MSEMASMIHVCVHEATSEKLYDYSDPMVGAMRLCWDCRREIAIRTIERPVCVPIDFGRFGYDCAKCGGTYTNIDPGTCQCPTRKRDCAELSKVVDQFHKWAVLCLWKPKRNRKQRVSA
jgi:hypothetical protein